MLAAFARSIDVALRSTSACNRIIQNQPIVFADGRRIEAEFKYIKSLPSFRSKPVFAHGYQARIGAQGKDAYGVGFADLSTTAMQSSIAEAVERFCFAQIKSKHADIQTSNGWAAHINEELCEAAAISELVERDAVLVHWLSKTPLIRVSSDLSPNWVRHLTSKLQSKINIASVQILKTQIGAADVAVALLIKPDGKFALGSATGSTFERAARKATVEAMQILVAAESDLLSNESAALLDPAMTSSPPPLAHGLVYARHLEVPEWLCGKHLSWSQVDRNWRAPNTTELKRLFKISFKKVAVEPFVVGYARSELLQDLFVGSTRWACATGHLNLRRLDTLGLALRNSTDPHPIA